MATNYPGPYQVRIHYSTTPSGLAMFRHVMQLNVALDPEPTPGDVFSTIQAVRRDTGTQDLDAMVDALVAEMLPFYSTAGTIINYAELWKFTPETFKASYVSSYAISEAGEDAGSNRGTGQQIWTFRTLEGGIMKVVTMESILTPDSTQDPGDFDADMTAFAAVFTTASTGVWLARDTSYPFMVTHMHPGEDEYTFKKRYRE